MARAAEVGEATTTETDDTEMHGTTTRTAVMDPREATVHRTVREIMDTPVRVTAATILATETILSGCEIQAGALEGIIQGVNP